MDLEAAFLKHLGDQFTLYIGREAGMPAPPALKERRLVARARSRERLLAEKEQKRQAKMRHEQAMIARQTTSSTGPQVKFDQLARIVCAAHDVEMADVLSETKRSPIVKARFHLMYLAREHLKMGWTEIGWLMRRDHSTVNHGVEQFALRHMDLPVYAEVMQLLAEAIPASETDTSS